MADGKDPKKRENYLIRALKTYAPFGLYIEDSFWQTPQRIIDVTGAFTFFISFGILVGPGRDLGQDFFDITFAI